MVNTAARRRLPMSLLSKTWHQPSLNGLRLVAIAHILDQLNQNHVMPFAMSRRANK